MCRKGGCYGHAVTHYYSSAFQRLPSNIKTNDSKFHKAVTIRWDNMPLVASLQWKQRYDDIFSSILCKVIFFYLKFECRRGVEGQGQAMNDVKESLSAVERKKQRFKQQQFIFTSALERSQEEAHGRAEPVKTVLQVWRNFHSFIHCYKLTNIIIYLWQVRRYMIHHCSNATDRNILSFFLEIVSDLNNVLRLINASCRNPPSDALITCKVLLHPDSDISKLHAQ